MILVGERVTVFISKRQQLTPSGLHSAGDGSFVLKYFLKAKALANLLISRHAASLQFSQVRVLLHGVEAACTSNPTAAC